jgi:hypothetical protein
MTSHRSPVVCFHGCDGVNASLQGGLAPLLTHENNLQFSIHEIHQIGGDTMQLLSVVDVRRTQNATWALARSSPEHWL